MRELLVQLPNGMRPRTGLEHELRNAIRSGRLLAGSSLPSTRALAGDLGIARSTVVAAYEQLRVEGYLHARQGRSTTVASIEVPDEPVNDDNPIGAAFAHDFRPGEPSLGSFPRHEWQRCLRRVVLDAGDEVFGYGDPRGRLELRESLARYLARARTVHVDPSAVRIYGGFASALGFIGEMFMRHGITRIAVEEPMLGFHRHILELVGMTAVPIPVDGDGMRVDHLEGAYVHAALVTPANQQPLGVTMSSARRNALVAWARSIDGWIVEDDYDGEFRYDRRPIGALQGLDVDRVLYAGTASKSLGPGLHLSWLVVPRGLRRDLAAVTHVRAGVSTINQLALADLIDRGGYDRHIRQQRRTYRRRRAVVAERLSEIDRVAIGDGNAGMHLVAYLSDGPLSEAQLIEQAAEMSVGLVGLQTHFGHHTPGLVINVSRPADHHFTSAVDALLLALAAQ